MRNFLKSIAIKGTLKKLYGVTKLFPPVLLLSGFLGFFMVFSMENLSDKSVERLTKRALISTVEMLEQNYITTSCADTLNEHYQALQQNLDMLPQELADSVQDELHKKIEWKFFPYNAATLKAYSSSQSTITGLSFSPCGTFMATGSEDGDIYVWDLQARMRTKHIVHEPFVKKISFISHRLLAVMHDRTPVQCSINLFDPEGTCQKRINF